jgi:beta-lactamase regulating signal transducer with metallopeptidase domain/HEAT repeat protein
MNPLLQWAAHPLVHRLGWTLLHFLWQGAAIAGLFAAAQTAWPKRSGNARYLTGCLALLLLLAAPLITFGLLRTERSVPVVFSAGGPPSNQTDPTDPTDPSAVAETAGSRAEVGRMGQIGQMKQPRPAFAPAPNPQSEIRNPQLSVSSFYPEKLLPFLVFAWLLGVSALSLRLLISSLHVARLKRRGHEPPGADWLERLDRLKAALQISRPVRLVKSVLVEVPAVVGWLRPVILLPAAALTGLAPAQLETILAHELAHIRRHDYLVNLLQNALETLLFYHPAVWWISSAVRSEREICCDEIAVKICGDRLVHARALAALEQLRAARPSLALGADGGSLLERIRRLSGAPAGRSFPSRRRAGGALVAALVTLIFISLLHQPSSIAKAQPTPSAVQSGSQRPEAASANPQLAAPKPDEGGSTIPHPQSNNAAPAPANPAKPAENPSGLSLVIRGPRNAVKVGDEIPIEFILSNHGLEDYQYTDHKAGANFRLVEFKLAATNASGESVPDPYPKNRVVSFGLDDGNISFLHPGESMSRIFALNRWALIKESGHYEVSGACLPASFSKNRFSPVIAAPIKLTILPRTEEEMAGYVEDLTNQVAAQLAIRVRQRPRPADPAFATLLVKLMYTCRPEIVPTLLRILYEDYVPGFSPNEALLYYVPKTEETWQAILQAVARQGPTSGLNQMEQLLLGYDFNNQELRPVIARALASDNPREWAVGAQLAASRCYDDSFAPRLITIALDTSNKDYIRSAAIDALALNRTDAGVKTLKALVNDTNLWVGKGLAEAIEHGYDSYWKSPTGRRLQNEDFDAKDVRPLVERLLASNDSFSQFMGLIFERTIADDELTSTLVALATNPGFRYREHAINALALNRTDEGVKTLKMLLNDPDPITATATEKAIRYAYLSPGTARGRPLHADDFAPRFQHPDNSPDKTDGVKPIASANTNAIPEPVNSTKPGEVPSGLSVVIRCTGGILKMGDAIPIQFIIYNDGTETYKWHENWDQIAYSLTAKDSSGATIPAPRTYPTALLNAGLDSSGIGSGGTFNKTIFLNGWAVIKEAGRYEVGGSYLPEGFSPITAKPISITVLPRTEKEMDEYIQGLTNQVAARLPGTPGKKGQPGDEVLDGLLTKLRCTCSPKVVPTLLNTMYEPGSQGIWEREALLYYVPKSEETWHAILHTAAEHGLDGKMYALLHQYDFHNEELKPFIERALAAQDSAECWRGVSLASDSYYDDSFTPALIALVSDASTASFTRSQAIQALARNRTDEGVKKLKTLFHDPDLQVLGELAMAIENGFNNQIKSPSGRHLRSEDFDAKEIRPLIDRFLTQGNPPYDIWGLNLAALFWDDALTQQVIALAVKPVFLGTRAAAMRVLAFNRTDEGVMMLKRLLNDPDQGISISAAQAVRDAYTSRSGNWGKPLRPDDFDVKYQQPEPTPAVDLKAPEPTTAPSSPNPQSELPPSDWGEATNGLRTRLVVEKHQFRAGEPIRITIEVTNISDQTKTFQTPAAPYNDGLVVLDAKGHATPFIDGPSQVGVRPMDLAPGQTTQVKAFDLTEFYYLRRPGRYTVQLPAERFLMPMLGESNRLGLPLSGKLAIEIVADAAADVDGDPDGRLLPVLRERWWLADQNGKMGRVRPGSNREEVFGRALRLEYNPTGYKADTGVIWIWLTDQLAAERVATAGDTDPASECLGQAGRLHVYFSAETNALKGWPTAKEDILRALRDGPGGELPADPASANPQLAAPRPDEGGSAIRNPQFIASSVVTGTVLLPNGQPAAGAQVALAVPGYPLYLLRAKMQGNYGGTNPLVVADEEGRFSLPPNESAWAIIAMNEAGCAQVERRDFENGSNITLQPWGHIEGVLRVGTRPGPNQQVVLGAAAGARFFFDLQAFQDKTDLDGKFVFTHVPPGTWHISHGSEHFWDGELVTVKAGETNHVTLGGTGRPVIGKVMILPVLTNPRNQASLPPSRWYLAFSDPATNPLFATGRAPEYEVDATLYASNHMLKSQMALDGTFRVEDVIPGTWWLEADVLQFPKSGGASKTIATMGKTVVVPEIAGGRSDEPLDLGKVEPVMVHSPQVGEDAPSLEVKTVDGKTFRLADHHGQYVLLDFEPLSWKSETNQPVKAVWTSFGKSDRLAMLTLQVPPTSSYSYLNDPDKERPWPQSRLGDMPWYELKPLRASFGLQCDRSIEADPNLPAVFLIGPDGKIIAKDLHGDAIKAAVAKALAKK